MCPFHYEKWMLTNSPVFREKKRRSNNARWRRLQQRMRDKIAEALGGWVCADPFGIHEKPLTDRDVLTFDHKNDDGAQDRRNHGSAEYTFRYYAHNLEAAKANLQILCFNCNWKKRRAAESKAKAR
jgi:hypothetical protein